MTVGETNVGEFHRCNVSTSRQREESLSYALLIVLALASSFVRFVPKWKVTLVDAYPIHVVFGMLGVQALEEGSSHLHYDHETFVSESPNAGSVPVAMIDSCDYSVIHEEHGVLARPGCL